MPKRKPNIKKIVKSVLHQSKETQVASFSNTTTVQDESRTPVLHHLTAIAQGDDQHQRAGNFLRLTGAYFKGYVTAADTTNAVRIMVVRLKRAYTATPLTAFGVITLPDFDQMEVLYDKFITVSTYGPGIRPFEIKLNFRKGNKLGMPISYDGTLAADVAENPLYLYAVSDSLTISDPGLDYVGRVYYKDY